ncbi:hypothetical protein B0H12DRAFT_1073675 [Mycena haematopus]|nr:hypothetical protein B0H12DRAFT_1073675 [Mycena haematopus]
MVGVSLQKRRTVIAKTSTAASRAVQISATSRSTGRRTVRKTLTLTPAQARRQKEEEEREEAARRTALSEEQRRAENAWRDDVLRGRTTADISHAGEALQDEDEETQQTLLEELRAQQRNLYGRRRREHRTRADRTQIRVDAFAAQMPQMVDAYLEWAVDGAERGLGSLYHHPEDTVVEASARVYVVDLFSYYADAPLVEGDQFVASGLIRQGLVPVAPHLPSVVITLRALEVFRTMQLRCPRLGIQPFVRALCDLHAVAPRPYLSTQFSIAFDVYLAIRAEGGGGCGRQNGAGCIKERHDNRVAPGDYYLTREEVDAWSKEGLEELMKEFVPGSELPDEGDGCTERGKTCVRTALPPRVPALDRRHDQERELAKYGFAITAHLIRVLGELGLGYDIGCKFGKMGMGLEDLEGCESFFSKSNALAATTRYSTAFHRQQAITTYLKHADTADAYQGLSLVLANKYRRALKIKGTAALLHETMTAMGVESRAVFEAWLQAEKTYLNSLAKEPEQETLQMEYYQKLVNLQDHEERLDVSRNVATPFIPAETEATYGAAAAQTRRIETQRRHALEIYGKTLDAVQDLEVRLDIKARWKPGDEDWVAAAALVEKRRYQRAIDELEGLVVARMFELSKVNMSDTGYKLRKHIAKALQARSKAVKTALERYNAAAAAMVPARTPLSWDQVVDYAFLAEFDLLREGREDIRGEPWAQPAGRAAMDQHFKLLRAEEEIARLNLEIPRLVTYMVDEEAFLVYHEKRLQADDQKALAHQVGVHRQYRGRFNAVHMERLVKLSKEHGFTASLSPGISVNKERRVPAVLTRPDDDVEMYDAEATAAPPPLQRGEEEEDEGEDADLDGEAVADAFENIMRIADDTAASRGTCISEGRGHYGVDAVDGLMAEMAPSARHGIARHL